MTPPTPPDQASKRPRIGIPWDTAKAEANGDRGKIAEYEGAVRNAGGEPVVLSLKQRSELQRALPELDGFVLPGSPADIKPADYGAQDLGVSAPADVAREETDRTILDYAISGGKPVLAICFGCQFLNVHLGGTLIQDLRKETGTMTPHSKNDVQPPLGTDPHHDANFEPGSRLAAVAGGTRGDINSSHHQAIAKAGKNLRITARAVDGIVEGIEWTEDKNWVVGVQWHPERMTDAPSRQLFKDFVDAARGEAERQA
jgi:putative glutamine amidotransferase